MGQFRQQQIQSTNLLINNEVYFYKNMFEAFKALVKQETESKKEDEHVLETKEQTEKKEVNSK